MTAAELRVKRLRRARGEAQRGGGAVRARLDLPKPFPPGKLELQTAARAATPTTAVAEADNPRILAEAPAAGARPGKTPDVPWIGESLGTTSSRDVGRCCSSTSTPATRASN
jgi:hypothetical protein